MRLSRARQCFVSAQPYSQDKLSAYNFLKLFRQVSEPVHNTVGNPETELYEKFWKEFTMRKITKVVSAITVVLAVTSFISDGVFAADERAIAENVGFIAAGPLKVQEVEFNAESAGGHNESYWWREVGLSMAVQYSILQRNLMSGGYVEPQKEKEAELPEELEKFERDIIETNEGNLKITFLGHATLIFEFAGMVIHVDPWSKFADYSKLPDADLILVTHEHGDHFDPEAIDAVRNKETQIVLTKPCTEDIAGGIVMKNGDTKTISGLKIEAVPAYNIVHKRSNGEPFHPQGRGNGYVITFGDKRVYVAGDTENTPEMKKLKDIDIAFLPMNLPYTMSPEMVADAAKAFKPGILYPYHYSDTNPQELVELLKSEKQIEVRIRKLR